jgi:hypothetical protein
MIEALLHPGTKRELLALVQQGLKDGSLFQTGGVIRRAFPPNERGRIFAHLYQAGPLSDTTALSSLGNLVSLGTALSAVNLGVSVVGFAYLGHRMKRLESGVQALETAVRTGFDNVLQRLDRVDVQLCGIAALAQQGLTATELLHGKVDDLARQVDWSIVSRMFAAVESLRDIEAGRQAGAEPGTLAERLREVRVYLTGAAAELASRLDGLGPAARLRARMLVLALAQSIAAEAAAWRFADETPTAARVIAEGCVALREHVLALSRAFFGEEAVLMGEPSQWALLHAEQGLRTVAGYLIEQPWLRPHELEAKWALAWATAAGSNPRMAKAALQCHEPMRRHLVAATALAHPLVEADAHLEGLALEYSALSAGKVTRQDWEGSQQGTSQPSLFIRAAF